MAIAWDTAQIPFSAGMQTKGDKRAQNPPALDVAIDCEFDDIGGLRTRKPYANLGLNILGGGTITNPRRIVENNGELLLFTSDTLYSWNAAASAWVAKGTHLAVKTRELQPGCTTSNDDQVTADRAELNGVAFYAWGNASSHVFYAAADVATGAVLVPPTQLSANANWQPRVVACTTRILLFYGSSAAFEGWNVHAFDPATLALSAATIISTTIAPLNSAYDVARVIGADAALAVAASGTSYTLAYVTSGLAVTTSTKARTADGAIAIASHPGGTNAQVIRGSGTSIAGDYVALPSLADVTINQAIGSSTPAAAHIAAAYRSVPDSGAYRCYAFWGNNENVDTYSVTGAVPAMFVNWVDTAGTIGAANANFKRYVGLASRAFDVGGRVFVNVVFAAVAESTVAGGIIPSVVGSLQNTYFLLRDDGFIAAKSVMDTAGGYAFLPALPNVSLSSDGSYRWAGLKRRLLPLGPNALIGGGGPRHPVEVVYTFDSNEARRCARLGRTLYLAGGGELLQYDGAQLVEVGQHVFPWRINLADAGAGGNLLAGTYAYKMYWRWDNAQGERERTTTATEPTTGTLAANHKVTITGGNENTLTHKTASVAAAEVWRTAVNPTADAPFYLVSGTDPGSPAPGSVNGYLANDPSKTAGDMVALTDNFSDDTLTTKEADPYSGSVLEPVAPPAATVITAGYDRLYIAGVPSNPCVIWYSKTRNDGEIASFNDALTVTMPPDGGDITGLQWLNETLIVFKASAVFALPGDGFDNLGGGANMGPARMLAADVGAVSQEAIAVTPEGLIFKTAKGWYRIDRSLALSYIGAPVATYDGEEIESADLVPGQHQVRIVTSGRVLVWDYLVNQWAEWSIAGGLGACVWNGAHLYLTAAGVWQQQATYSTASYGIDVESAWIKLADLQGAARVRRFMLLGEYRSDCSVRIRIARDYESDGAGSWAWFDDVTWAATPAIVGGPLQLRHGPSRQQGEAFKVRITVTPTTAGESIKLSGLGIEYGAKRGLFKRLPASQKA